MYSTEKGKYNLKSSYLIKFTELFTQLYQVYSFKESKDILRPIRRCSLHDIKTSHNHLFASILLMHLSQSSPRIHLQLNKLGLLLVAVRKNAHCGELWGVSVRGYEKEPIARFGLWLSIWDRGVKESQGFALVGCCQKAGAVLWLGVSLTLICRRKTRTRTVMIGKEAAVTYFGQKGIFGIL